MDSLCNPQLPFVPKVPTGDALLSSTMSTEIDLTFTSDTGGKLGLCLVPTPHSGYASYDSATGNWTVSNMASDTSFQANVSKFRPVSMCLSLKSMLNPMTVSGYVAMFLIPRNYGGAPRTIAEATSCAFNFTALTQEGGMVCWRPTDLEDLIFIDKASTGFTGTGTGTLVPNYHSAIGFVGSGLPVSTACFIGKLRINYEVIPGTDIFQPAPQEPIVSPLQGPPEKKVDWLGEALSFVNQEPIGGTAKEVAKRLADMGMDYGLHLLRERVRDLPFGY